MASDMAPAPETATTTYNGSCHCQSITFTAKLPTSLYEQDIVNCNCSLCFRNGYLLIYPQKNDVTFHGNSRDFMKGYQFNKRAITHYFCSNCGTSVGGEPVDDKPPIFAINIRALPDVDTDKLKLKKVDGKSR
ncbi:hypothetical protein AJ80_05542 [Polytolypa hystricis UAMH7299]|uniref:CENP-V/GFA domain-containing protein n=1 Tax=Polytolypa hystricis (strain UAMH7299) TaxID=1447883 RepID=A0A2B7Y3F5_POLH7|nr:hypothetical protein AJ80_05542 [Polytolypa hystricis UAMH7299]